MTFLKKTFLANTLIVIVSLISLAIFDASLELGKFHGLFFTIGSFYLLAGILILNLIAALILYFKNSQEKAKAFLKSGITVSLLTFSIVYFLASIYG